MRRSVLLILGLALLIALVRWVRPSVLVLYLSRLRWALPAMVALGFAKLILRSWSWWLALRAEGAPLRFRALFFTRLSAQTLGYLSLVSGVVTESLSPVLLRRHVSVVAGTAATVSETLTYWSASCLMGMLGSVAGAVWLRSTPGMLAPMLAAAAGFGGALVLLRCGKSVAPALRRWVVRWRGESHPASLWLNRAEVIEEQIRSFRRRHPAAERGMFGIGLLVQFAMYAEVAAVLWVLGLPVSPLAVLAMEASTRVVKIAGNWAPGRIGIDEAGAAGITLLFGLPAAAGLTIAVARRIQSLAWVLAGLIWLAPGAVRQVRKERIHAGSAVVAGG